MPKENDNPIEDHNQRAPDAIWDKVEHNRMERMMYGVSWSEQYGSPTEALAKANIQPIADMSAEEQLKLIIRIRSRL